MTNDDLTIVNSGTRTTETEFCEYSPGQFCLSAESYDWRVDTYFEIPQAIELRNWLDEAINRQLALVLRTFFELLFRE